MLVLVTYDVETVSRAGQKRLRRVAKLCCNYGVRVQNSVFECVINTTQYHELRLQLLDVINEDTDSICFYFLGKAWKRHVERLGKDTSLDVTGELIL